MRTNVKRVRGGLVFKTHRLLYHSTLGSKVMKKKKKKVAAKRGLCCPGESSHATGLGSSETESGGILVDKFHRPLMA
jgi:hypothetical protein